MSLVALAEGDYVTVPLEEDEEVDQLTPEQRERFITELEEKMREAARKFEFERAAQLRGRVKAPKIGVISASVINEEVADERKQTSG
ncbi:MAG TPA: UvrB/UvrC motif-containing protein [Bryobacteraceae bacterium]|nr:UvrB/UvrC motif-containing protein [Bryobacteraceae bacterium]